MQDTERVDPEVGFAQGARAADGITEGGREGGDGDGGFVDGEGVGGRGVGWVVGECAQVRWRSPGVGKGDVWGDAVLDGDGGFFGLDETDGRGTGGADFDEAGGKGHLAVFVRVAFGVEVIA